MTDHPKPQTLDFDTERGASRSKWVASALVIAITGWMGSGYIFPSEPQEDDTAEVVSTKLTSVATVPSQAETVIRNFVAEGQALPDRTTDLRAEATGSILEVLVKKGDTLWAIAKKYLGSGTKYPQIASENNIKNPNLIYPNQVLWIPA